MMMNAPTTTETALRTLDAVYAALDELNAQLPSDEHVEKAPHTHLFDEDGHLDSLHVVNLIVFTELAVDRIFGVSLSLMEHSAEAGEDNPFATVATFVDFVDACIAAGQ